MSERGETLELACLRALTAEADSRRLARHAASIVVHAYAAARAAPEVGTEALRIVEIARQIWAERPTRASLAALIDRTLAEVEPGGPRLRAGARDRLVERLLDHLDGAPPGGRG